MDFHSWCSVLNWLLCRKMKLKAPKLREVIPHGGGKLVPIHIAFSPLNMKCVYVHAHSWTCTHLCLCVLCLNVCSMRSAVWQLPVKWQYNDLQHCLMIVLFQNCLYRHCVYACVCMYVYNLHKFPALFTVMFLFLYVTHFLLLLSSCPMVQRQWTTTILPIVWEDFNIFICCESLKPYIVPAEAKVEIFFFISLCGSCVLSWEF